ncbi:DNA methyltransferase [Planctomycetales bacterium]|nr:DNA methyltransferase [Planctomycetales bacterium]
MQPIHHYVAELNRIFQQENATEHAYRPVLKTLIEAFDPLIIATNEPARQRCGAPDFVLTKKQRPLGYIETKTIGKDLDSPEYQEQFKRYLGALPNIIFTDYLRFQFWREGVKVAEISIGELNNGKIKPLKENIEQFENQIRHFCNFNGQTIGNADNLAALLAVKARVLSDAIRNALTDNAPDYDNQSLQVQFDAFQKILIPDIDIPTFSDVYAQTLAYGMFVARYHHKNGKAFTRQTAVESIPKSHPFLHKFFGYIAGVEIDERIKWVIDELADLLYAANLKVIMEDFGKNTQTEDPTIHFYENFLAAYNFDLRKDIGAFYTPLSAVRYIVQAADDILKEEFGCPTGLADRTKITVTIKDKNNKEQTAELHKVQILDPATGTGTFLAETVRHIHASIVSQGQQGIWNNYVTSDLLPRLHGFEILTAPYAMAHLKLDTILEQSGFQFNTSQRLGIYLTNALDEGVKKIDRLPFAMWLSDEAEGANKVKKKDTPVMVVIGNPPYNNYKGIVAHYNETAYAKKLIEKYKTGLNNQKLNLDDDYIKFIALGQNFIENNPDSCGLLAYISNNSFLDGITHRQMRKQLMETFDKIYILNLHGNARKKEKAPDGSKDENVFNIMQGTSINIFIRSPKKKKRLAKVYYADLYGKRQDKYNFLSSHRLKKTDYVQLKLVEPSYFFTPKDFSKQEEYENGFSIAELFPVSGTGVKTERDNVAVNFTRDGLTATVKDFYRLDKDELTYKYNLHDSRDWSVERAKRDIQKHYNLAEYVKRILYRPFDCRYIYYTGVSKGFVGTPGTKLTQQMQQDNIALLTTRMIPPNHPFNRVFVTKNIADIHSISDQTLIFPLYVYPLGEQQPNLNREILTKIETIIGKKVKAEKLFDYIYAVLHSPKYRETYQEFLKIDFPRIPYPKTADEFTSLSATGTKLRELHLLEKIPKAKTTFSITGSDTVDSVRYTNERVYVNAAQYFDGVPESAWNFYIGGYQPAQKYLKDRKGRKLSFEEIAHYQNIIAVLIETKRLMNEMDTY